MNSGSIAFKVCVVLANSPDSRLTRDQIVDRFDADPRTLHQALKGTLDNDWLETGIIDRKRCYYAGKRLLDLLGITNDRD